MAGITVSTSTVVAGAADGQRFVVVDGMDPFHTLTVRQARALAAELLAAADRVEDQQAGARAAGLLRFPEGGKAR